MKDCKIDNVQEIGLLGGAVAVVGSMLTKYASDKKLDEVVNEKVAKAIAEQLANLNRGE